MFLQDGIAIRRHTRTVTQKKTSSKEIRPSVTTPWYQADYPSDQLLDAPLRLKHKLTIGELYYHCTPTQYRLWLWTDDAVKGLHWAPVKCGYQRGDGRYLIITNKDKFPSWVLHNQYVRALPCEPVLSTVHRCQLTSSPRSLNSALVVVL